MLNSTAGRSPRRSLALRTSFVRSFVRSFDRVAELADPKTTSSVRLDILAGIRTALERHTSMASSSAVLQRATLAAVITAAPADPALRSAALEHISRINISDVPKESITPLIQLCVDTLQTSTEDDGALAQEILGDVFKAYKSLQGMEELTSPYLQWLVQLFDGLPNGEN